MGELTESAVVNRQEISRLLRERGATQADLAQAMDISQSALSQLLSGRRRISVTELPLFARFLGIRVSDAFRLFGVDVEDAA